MFNQSKEFLKEGGFSLRNASLKDNISELSIDSKRVIIDHMLSNGLKPETMDINTPLMVAFKSARTKYEESKKLAKKEKVLTEQENQKRMLTIEISEAKKKIDSLNKTVSYLDEQFTNSIFQAEEQSVNEQTQLIAKATALKRKSMSKSEEAKRLEEQVKILEAKRKKL